MEIGIIGTFTNTELGLQSFVTFTGTDFRVVLKDTDAMQFVGVVYIYADYIAAVDYAEKLVIG